MNNLNIAIFFRDVVKNYRLQLESLSLYLKKKIP